MDVLARYQIAVWISEVDFGCRSVSSNNICLLYSGMMSVVQQTLTISFTVRSHMLEKELHG